MKECSDRLYWVDGLKGIACLLIFTHHFLLAFYPASYYGINSVSHFKYDTWFATSPISFIVNGNFLVHLFCILSGLLISYNLIKNFNIDRVSNSLLKRYFHFSIPILIVGLVVYIMLKFHLFTNISTSLLTGSSWLSSYYTNILSLKQILISALINTLFVGDDMISTAFWMMSYIFYGTFLTYILNFISFHKNRKILYFYIILLVILIFLNSYMACFVIGYLLAYGMIKIKNKLGSKIDSFIGIVFLILGFFFGGYPSGVIPTNIYSLLPNNIFLFHLIGATFVIIGVYFLNPLKRIFSTRIFKSLGKISFSIYLIHIPLLFSFSTTLFSFLFYKNGRYQLDSAITYFASICMLLVIAFLFDKIVGPLIKKVESKIIKFVEDN